MLELRKGREVSRDDECEGGVTIHVHLEQDKSRSIAVVCSTFVKKLDGSLQSTESSTCGAQLHSSRGFTHLHTVQHDNGLAEDVEAQHVAFQLLSKLLVVQLRLERWNDAKVAEEWFTRR